MFYLKNMFYVIFPMAGKSSRFNYKFKPFLKFSDMYFIELAVKYFLNYINLIKKIFFIVTRKQFEDNNIEKILNNIFPNINYQLIILEKETDSQYETIINFIEETSIKGEVFICDCDHSIDIKPMMEYLKKNSPDILIPIWNIEKENKKSWGKVYILDGEIKDFCEKNSLDLERMEEKGIIGCSFFKNIEILLLEKNLKNLSDFYKIFLNKLKINFVNIEKADFFGDQERLNKLIKINREKITVFCDIDGTLFQHESNPTYTELPIVLNSTCEKLQEWREKNYYIVLTTARKNREKLIRTLKKLKITYDELISCLPSGPRVLINDIKPSHIFTLQARQINIKRNKGINEINLNSTISEDNILFKFKGGSFSETILIENKKRLFVRKIIYKDKNNEKHINKLKFQYNNLSRFNNYLKNICPGLIDEKNNEYYYYYDMEYLENYEVLSKVTNKNNILKQLILTMKDEIYCMKKINKNENWIQDFINEKINFDNIEHLSDNIKKIINMDNLIINGIKCIGLKQKLKSINIKKFNPKFLSPIHGDLTYENILYNKELSDIKLIDLDGANYIDAIELDFSKILQSEISKYEIWSSEKNIVKKIDFENNIIETVEYLNKEKIDDLFQKYLYWKDILELKNIGELKKTGYFFLFIHLFRMIPFRFNKSEEQAIYAIKEMIFYLNEV